MCQNNWQFLYLISREFGIFLHRFLQVYVVDSLTTEAWQPLAQCVLTPSQHGTTHNPFALEVENTVTN